MQSVHFYMPNCCIVISCCVHWHQALENRTLDSKREMDIMNALDEVKSLKARQEGISTDALLAALKRSDDEDQAQLDKADEAMVGGCVCWNELCACSSTAFSSCVMQLA